MFLQHGLALADAVKPHAQFTQLRVAAHLRNRHSGRAQAQQERDPVEVCGTVKPVAVAVARNGLDQPDALVIAQGVRAQAAGSGRLPDRQGVCHGENGRSWSAL